MQGYSHVGISSNYNVKSEVISGFLHNRDFGEKPVARDSREISRGRVPFKSELSTDKSVSLVDQVVVLGSIRGEFVCLTSFELVIFPLSAAQNHLSVNSYPPMELDMQGIKCLIVLLVVSCMIPERAAANTVGVCIRNCAQCKKMFGAYFQGELCADTCLKFKGKLIPDCEDVTSIGPFLNKID